MPGAYQKTSNNVSLFYTVLPLPDILLDSPIQTLYLTVFVIISKLHSILAYLSIHAAYTDLSFFWPFIKFIVFIVLFDDKPSFNLLCIYIFNSSSL